MKSPFQIPYVALMLAAVSCTDFQEKEISVSFGVDVNQVEFRSAASSRSVTVSSGTMWDVTSLPRWITLQSIQRSALSSYEWVVDFKADANEEYDREGTITIKSGTETSEIAVIQEGEKGKYVAVESVSLSHMDMNLTVGENATLAYTISPENASVKDVTWKSSAPSVLTVSQSGRVDALAEGYATVTVTTEDGNKTATCTITVNPVRVSSVRLNHESLTLTIGEMATLTPTVLPENAANKNVSWTSSNTSVATVDSNGKVTAISTGFATITVTTEDGGKTASCSVTVNSGGIVDGSENGHEYVDLGLPSGVKWATCNVGASTPEEYGNYYAWGETDTKSEYNWENYKFRISGDSDSDVKLSKYVDGIPPQLEYSDDAARANWGGKWRMPMYREIDELRNYCTFTWTTQNGVNGCKVSGM